MTTANKFLSCRAFMFHAVVTGLGLGLFMAISVGPTLFAVIKYSLNHSYKAGLAFIMGVSISDIMYVAIANVAASWLETLSEYEKQITFGGATVLIIVGLAGLIKKYKPARPSSTQISISNAHLFKIWSSGFLINTFNPGVIIVWLSAVTATADKSGWYRFILFAVCLGLILSIDMVKVFAADVIRRKLTIRRVFYLHKFSAACILGIGVLLLVSTFFNIEVPVHEAKSVYQEIRYEGLAKSYQRLVSLQPHV